MLLQRLLIVNHYSLRVVRKRKTGFIPATVTSSSRNDGHGEAMSSQDQQEELELDNDLQAFSAAATSAAADISLDETTQVFLIEEFADTRQTEPRSRSLLQSQSQTERPHPFAGGDYFIHSMQSCCMM